MSDTIFFIHQLGRTPLHYASETGRANVVALLVADPRVDPSAADGVWLSLLRAL